MKGDAMKDRFVERHADRITGVLSSFDRVIIKGHLRPICWSGGMEQFMAAKGVLIKDFGGFVNRHSESVKEHARKVADKAARPYIPLKRQTDKEARARRIAERDGIKQGLVCVFSAVEGCQSFKIIGGVRRPQLINAPRKCLCVYYYLMHRDFGLIHVRVQTWFPFTVQIYLNGHEWLARQMNRAGIAYEQCDNAFFWIEAPAKAQRLANRFVRIDWPMHLNRLARMINPLMRTLFARMDYYWVTDQAEFATDVMFRSPKDLKLLYEKLLEHSTLCLSAEDVMVFLGRKLHGNFKGEVIAEFKKRWPGARARHRMNRNWIKMYNKHGAVLRIETVINDPYEFRVRRKSIRQGRPTMAWLPMAKRVSNLYKYAEVSLMANRRYLNALSVVADPTEGQALLCRCTQRIHVAGRSYRGFNPAAQEDIRLFLAVMRGEHAIHGFRNRDLRERLFAKPADLQVRRRQSAAVSRMLKRLRVRHLVGKMPHTRRWHTTHAGHAFMSMAIMHHRRFYPDNILAALAA
jgi:hypothetical protein